MTTAAHVAAATTVRICALTREWTTFAWLCEKHRGVRERGGWRIFLLDTPEAFHGRVFIGACQDCPAPPQPPAVDFVPTLSAATLPGRASAPTAGPMADLRETDRSPTKKAARAKPARQATSRG